MYENELSSALVANEISAEKLFQIFRFTLPQFTIRNRSYQRLRHVNTAEYFNESISIFFRPLDETENLKTGE